MGTLAAPLPRDAELIYRPESLGSAHGSDLLIGVLVGSILGVLAVAGAILVGVVLDEEAQLRPDAEHVYPLP